MKKRTISAILWLYAGWYGGTLLTEVLGIHMLVGLIPAVVMAGVVLEIPSRISAASPTFRRIAGSDSI